MFRPFLSKTFWTDHVDWTAAGLIADKIDNSATGVAAKAFLVQSYAQSHIAGDPSPLVLNGTAGNDLIECLSTYGARDGTGNDVVILHAGVLVVYAEAAADPGSVDIFVSAPAAGASTNLHYTNDTMGVKINLQSGWASGEATGKDKLISLNPARNWDGIHLGSGDDVVYGTEESEPWVQGFSGNDKLVGYGGNDRLEGGDGSDWLLGGDGDDQIDGEDGHDRIIGGTGDDLLNYLNVSLYDPGADGDYVNGGDGNDLVVGTTGDDRLIGGDGDDRIWGALFGGGFDLLRGGNGADTFWVGQVSGGKKPSWQVVVDFTPGTDKIRPAGYIFAYEDYVDHARDTAGGLVCDNGNGSVVVLRGITLAMLDATDFIA